jgi:hypothetical protein
MTATTVAGTVLLLLGLGTVYLALGYGVGTLSLPGPGFFPLLVGALLSLLAFFYLYAERGQRRFHGGRWTRPAQAVALTFTYVVLLDRLGYLIATVLLLVAFVGLIERQNARRTAAVAVLGTLGMYLVFRVWLRVPLPQGLLGF